TVNVNPVADAPTLTVVDDVANFSRAFKRWSGRSPSNWRKDPYL
ncbi:hypothetical protein OPU39_17685, partial [Acinetobacter nosocomialis]|nr:hypothetical protein [Acinetobacter nosocomialis]